VESKALPLVVSRTDTRRQRLVARAKSLAWLGLGWHGLEAAIAIGAGLAAGSIALIGFGADSVIESLAGFVILWRFGAERESSETAERRAYRLIGISFYLLAAYVGIEATRQLIDGAHPETSWVGIGLGAVTLATMPLLARAKAKVAEQLSSAATRAEGRQNMLCAYLSAGLIVGLGANAVLGWWWADPAVALLIAAVAVREGREAWRGEACCDAC
jgi:divalent metal cation (Fe/Co/Zn/Cd) transporter